MNGDDIRWKQRFDNYQKALAKLVEGINDYGANPLPIIKEGIIQRFEFTHELAWKVLQDYLQFEGALNINGSRSATREAFNRGLITQGQVWMDMVESRNITVHTYQSDILETEFFKITHDYLPLLLQLEEKMTTLL